MNDNDFVQIPAYLIRTLRPEGYISRFYALISASSLSHVEAFEAIENEREQYGLPHGYDNYQSFVRGKSYHMRKGVFRLLD